MIWLKQNNKKTIYSTDNTNIYNINRISTKLAFEFEEKQFNIITILCDYYILENLLAITKFVTK